MSSLPVRSIVGVVLLAHLSMSKFEDMNFDPPIVCFKTLKDFDESKILERYNIEGPLTMNKLFSAVEYIFYTEPTTGAEMKIIILSDKNVIQIQRFPKAKLGDFNAFISKKSHCAQKPYENKYNLRSFIGMECVILTKSLVAEDSYYYIVGEVDLKPIDNHHMLDQFKNAKPDFKINFMHKCLEFAEELHGAGFINGTIEPKHILTNDDFTIVKIMIAPREYLDKIYTSVYHAPEIIDKITEYSNKSDMYSLALTLIKLLDKEKRLTSFINNPTIKKTVSGNKANIVDKVYSIFHDNSITKVVAPIEKALQFKPDDRYNSMALFRLDFLNKAAFQLII